MREWSKLASTLLLGFCLWTFCFCVYLSNLPVNYTYDGMVFASHIESDKYPLWDYFHPHHLLYTFLGRLVFLWGREAGALWDGLVALQFFDIMTGTLGVLIAFHLLVRVTQDRLVSFLTAAGLSFTYSYWYFSTSPGVRIFATVTPLLAWYTLSYLKNNPPVFGLAVGLAHTFAVTGHQTNLLLVPAFLGGIWCLRERTAADRFKASLYYLAALTVGVLSVYGFVGRFICYRKTYEAWVWWVFSYMHVAEWGGHLQEKGIARGQFAMIQAFLRDTLPYKTMTEPFTFYTAKIIFQYAVITLSCLLLMRLKRYWDHYRQTLWVGILWLLAFVPFFIWWEPWNIEFWVSSTVPCWILLGVTVSDISKRWKNPILHHSNRAVILTLWSGLVLLLFFYNFQKTIHRTPPPAHGQSALLGALDWKVRVDDLLILDGVNTIPFYLDRYQKRDYLNLHAFLKKYKKKEKEEKERLEKEKKLGKKPIKPSVSPTPTPDPWKDLSDVFQSTWKRKRKVWALNEAVEENDAWREKLERMMKLPEGQLVAFFGQYKLEPVEYQGKIYFYEVLRPSPTPTPHPSEIRLTPAPIDFSIPAKTGKKK